MTVYCIERSKNEADSKLLQEDMNNLLRWESDWQKSSIQVNTSFYVLPTSVRHIPQVTTDIGIN